MATPRILLVCSAGGHLLQLHALKQVWGAYPHHWVSLKKADSESLLASEPVTWAYGPTNRNILNLIRNLVLAVRVLLREKPTIIISTGAGVAVPFIWLGWVLRIHPIYLESYARRRGFSLSGKLVRPVASEFIVQHPELAQIIPGVSYYGSVY